MTAPSRTRIMALCCLLAAPAQGEGWRVESQLGDLLRVTPHAASTDRTQRNGLFVCLHDLTGNGRKGFSLAAGPAPQFVAAAGASACAGITIRPQVLYLWREDHGEMREVLRLPLRAGDLRGTGLHIDWMAK